LNWNIKAGVGQLLGPGCFSKWQSAGETHEIHPEIETPQGRIA
jgi:hypothetical protein